MVDYNELLSSSSWIMLACPSFPSCSHVLSLHLVCACALGFVSSLKYPENIVVVRQVLSCSIPRGDVICGPCIMTHTHSVHVVILDGCVCYLQDANDNKIKQYPADGATSPNSDDGIFEGQLQLSDQPVQGTWKIHVDAQVRPAAAVRPAGAWQLEDPRRRAGKTSCSCHRNVRWHLYSVASCIPFFVLRSLPEICYCPFIDKALDTVCILDKEIGFTNDCVIIHSHWFYVCKAFKCT